jgi:hypothetical protein
MIVSKQPQPTETHAFGVFFTFDDKKGKATTQKRFELEFQPIGWQSGTGHLGFNGLAGDFKGKAADIYVSNCCQF